MNVSFLTRLLPAACAVVVASSIFAQSAPAPVSRFRTAERAPAPAAQDPAPAPASRAESADRVQTRLAEVMSMLEEEQMSAEMQQKALAKLTEVMERLKKERAAGQYGASTTRPAPAARFRVEGHQDPDAVPVPVPPKAHTNDKVKSAEAMGVPMPPKAPKAPKPPKTPKTKVADGENPFDASDFHAKVHAEAEKAHEQALKAHEEAAKVHEKMLRVHHEQQAKAEAAKVDHDLMLKKMRASEQAAEGLKGEPGLLRKRLVEAEAAEDGARAKERGLTFLRTKQDATPQWERDAAPQAQKSRAPAGARIAREAGGDDEAEIRATIESMRSELREIRALLKQLGDRSKNPQ